MSRKDSQGYFDYWESDLMEEAMEKRALLKEANKLKEKNGE